MRISVNLASRPFVELRPFFTRLRIVMGALAVVAIGLMIATHSMQKKLNDARAQMDQLKARTLAAQQEKQRNEAKMRQPANAAVLERSRFLNELFLRKSFSWTAVMMDLETVLPSGVQITSIEPQPTADGPLVIRLRVAGDRDRAILLVRNLERSKRFRQPRLSTEAQQAKTANGAPVAPGATAGVEFEVLANYNPIPADGPLVKTVSDKPKSPGTKANPHAPKAGAANPAPGKPAITLKPFVKPAATPRPMKGGSA